MVVRPQRRTRKPSGARRISQTARRAARHGDGCRLGLGQRTWPCGGTRRSSRRTGPQKERGRAWQRSEAEQRQQGRGRDPTRTQEPKCAWRAQSPAKGSLEEGVLPQHTGEDHALRKGGTRTSAVCREQQEHAWREARRGRTGRRRPNKCWPWRAERVRTPLQRPHRAARKTRRRSSWIHW